MVGDEKQSQGLVSLSEQYQSAPEVESNIFRQVVYEMVNDGLHHRRMPDDVRVKVFGPCHQRRGHRHDLHHLWG